MTEGAWKVSQVPKFSGDEGAGKFTEWTMKIEATVFNLGGSHGKDFIEPISAVSLKPGTDGKFPEVRELCNQAVYNTIVLALDGDALRLLINKGVPKGDGRAAWIVLHEKYASVDRHRVAALQAQLLGRTWSTDDTISSFERDFMFMRAQLIDVGKPIDDEVLTFQLLRSLPGQFTAYAATLLDEKFDLHRMFQKLRLFEAALGVKGTMTSPDPAASTAFYSRGPDSRDAARGAEYFSGKCYYCKKPGHRERHCRGRKKDEADGKVAPWRPGDTAMAPQTEPSMAAAAPARPAPSQGQRGGRTNVGTSATFNARCFATMDGVGVPSFSWCLDGGATDHVASDRSVFTSLQLFPAGHRHHVFGFAGSSVAALGKGDIHLRFLDVDGNVLQVNIVDALWVPDSSVNLLSLRKLVHDAEGRPTGHMYQAGPGPLTLTFTDAYAGLVRHVASQAMGGLDWIVPVQEAAGTASGLVMAAVTSSEGMVVPDSATVLAAHAGAAATFGATGAPVVFDVFHARIGHASRDKTWQVAQEQGIELIKDLKLPCEVCLSHKSRRQPVAGVSESRSTKSGTLIHIDVWGPARSPTFRKERYAMQFTDDFSCFTTVYAMREKSEAPAMLRKFVADNATGPKETRLDLGPDTTLQTDNGAELVGTEFLAVCAELGFRLRTAPPYTPQHNGSAERRWGSLASMVRCLQVNFGRRLDSRFWFLAMRHAAFLLNRLPTRANGDLSPFQVLSGERPDLAKLRVFGSRVWVHDHRRREGKLGQTALRGFYVGHNMRNDSAIVFLPTSNNCIDSRDVAFVEVLPGVLDDSDEVRASGDLRAGGLVGALTQGVEHDDGVPVEDIAVSLDDSDDCDPLLTWDDGFFGLPDSFVDTSDAGGARDDNVDDGHPCASDDDHHVHGELVEEAEVRQCSDDEPIHGLDGHGEESRAPPGPVRTVPGYDTRRSGEAGPGYESEPPGDGSDEDSEVVVNLHSNGRGDDPLLDDFDDDPLIDDFGLRSTASVAVRGTSGALTTTRGGAAAATVSDEGKDELVDDDLADLLVAEARLNGDPTTFDEAVNGPDGAVWRAAIDTELAALLKNETWELVKRRNVPSDKRVLSCFYVFKTKRGADREILKRKARLVVRGNRQRAGIDYGDIFAPVVGLKALRVTVAMAAAKGWVIDHVDVESAFLQSDLDIDVYMQVPQGMCCVDDDGDELVCLLHKSLYGLKQAPKLWHDTLAQHLTVDQGLQQARSAPCVYVQRDDDGSVNAVILVYVDDIIPAGKTQGIVDEFKRKLAARFKITDGGALSWCLGIQVSRNQHSITLTQEAYSETILQRFRMGDSLPKDTPLVEGAHLERPNKDDEPANGTLYRSIVGALGYLVSCTRPDLATAVSQLARGFQAPTKRHFEAAKRVLRYLRGTTALGLTYSIINGDNIPVGYADASYAEDVTERKSTSGYVFMMNGGAISWGSKLQSVIAQSTQEAEYIAANYATREALYLRALLKDLDLSVEEATTIYEDNVGCIKLAEQESVNERTKHIDVSFHFIRDHIQRKDIKMVYLPTAKMLADMMTKNLGKVKLHDLRTKVHGALVQ